MVRSKEITAQQIRDGITDGIVRFITDPNFGYGTVCAIGDNWFYFGGQTAEDEPPEEYISHVPMDDVVDEIMAVLEDFCTDVGFRDEYAYYKAILDEAEESKLLKCGLKNAELDPSEFATISATLSDRNALMERAWDALGNIPVDPETGSIKDPFLIFGPGTDIKEILHWFDERYNGGVEALQTERRG